ncbi:MAG TPA: SH3 domain-containing protein [Gemmatimonadales bacterium]|nr:SH3 domain-containing protein [Gemmatimonadales bacterium]
MAALLVAGPLAAQEERRVQEPTDLHRAPDGTPLVSLPAGAPVEAGKADGGWRQVTVEGWIYRPSTSPTKREGFDLVVTSAEGENLRRAPNGPIVGRAREGTLLERVGEKGKWFRVRRDGWVPREAVPAKAAPAKAAPAKAVPAKAAPAKPVADTTRRKSRPDTARQGKLAAAPEPSAPAGAPTNASERVEILRETGLSRAPDSAPLATLPAGLPAQVVSRSGEWVRVQVEGWVREADIKPAASGVLAGVSAAEVRASPEQFVGRTLDWRVQIIAVQIADELRPEIAPGQPYLLTRGPLPEPGFVYVTIPPERIAEFRALPPLHEMTLRVTLKAARTRYLATPVAELVSTPGLASAGG